MIRSHLPLVARIRPRLGTVNAAHPQTAVLAQGQYRVFRQHRPPELSLAEDGLSSDEDRFLLFLAAANAKTPW